MTQKFALICLLLGGCAATAVAQQQTLQIAAPQRPMVTITGGSELCKGGELILKVEGEYESFQWNTGHEGRYLKVKKAGIYEVTVRTKSGCTFTGSVNVQEYPCI